MSNIEKQLDAIMRCLAAETEEDREKARKVIRGMICEADAPAPVTSGTIATCIDEILLDLGIPCHIKGYGYLITAIGAVVKKPNLVSAVTTELYPAVAAKHGTTKSRVERAIRHAVEVCWERGDYETLQDCFGNTVSSHKGKTTNSEFISRVAIVVRRRMQEAA